MPVIRFFSRRGGAIEVVHPTTPRVGIFVKAQRARSIGPQAHQSPYISDEEQAVRDQVWRALGRFTVIFCGIALGLQIARFIECAAISLDWITP